MSRVLFIPRRAGKFLEYARLLWTEATTGPNALNEARRREREAVVRYLRRASARWGPPEAAALDIEANRIAGGAHYR
ncbi:MAG TPA: hypothetical protein VK607_10545 [Kofleriaceae bacterium]|nr:hypothetical protein [Kofleriaceae bacterium]